MSISQLFVDNPFTIFAQTLDINNLVVDEITASRAQIDNILVDNDNVTGVNNLQAGSITTPLINTNLVNGDINIQPNGDGRLITNRFASDNCILGNIQIDQNNITSIFANSDININGIGTGKVNIENISVSGETISTTANRMILTAVQDIQVTALQVGTLNINNDNIQSTIANGSINLITPGTGTVNMTSTHTGLLHVDNIQINNNNIISTNTNGNINLTPNGTGTVVVSSLSTTGDITVDNIQINGNSIGIVNTDGNLNLNPNGAGVVSISKALNMNTQNINGVDTISCFTLLMNGTITTLSNTNLTLTTGGTGIVRVLKNLNMNSQIIDNVSTINVNFVTSIGNNNLVLTTAGTGIITPTRSLSMTTHKLSGELISRPWVNLGLNLPTNTQGTISWTTSILNPDFISFYDILSMPFIRFSVLGFYRITASATFLCTNANAPERQVFIEFKDNIGTLITASDQVIASESGNVFGNCAFNRIIQITSTAANIYFFNWGSFATGGTSTTLTNDSHVTIERVG